jgi:hypothetical protein
MKAVGVAMSRRTEELPPHCADSMMTKMRKRMKRMTTTTTMTLEDPAVDARHHLHLRTSSGGRR